MIRTILSAALLLSATGAAAQMPPEQVLAADPFAAFRPDIRARGLRAGISPATLQAAFDALVWLPEVIERDRTQNEFTKTVWEYLRTAVSEERIASGRRALEEHRATFDAIEARFGVDRHIVAAIWGLESSYGAVRGDVPTLSALATLSVEGRRRDLFSAQFMAALQILDQDQAVPADLRGSWAGAMGHTQFMPLSYLEHAVDLTGDGRRNIWGDDPADALASTAAYLAAFGWNNRLPWGIEVRVPQGFDYTRARQNFRVSLNTWSGMGITTIDGAPVQGAWLAQLLLPAGHQGAAFLVFDNFTVLERYNPADAYVIAVGHLADRMRGGEPFVGTWPLEDRALSFDERIELQTLLTAAGFDTQGIDGLVGPKTIAAIRAFQQAQGMVPDGYAPPALLDRVRAVASDPDLTP